MNRTTAIVVAAGLTLSVAACGSNHTSAAPSRGAVAYAGCMRSHSVPNWPDPDTNGVFDKSKLTLEKLGASSTRVASAQAACRGLLPNSGRSPSSTQIELVRAQALRFSQCVRAHGVARFPDPASDGRIPDPAAVGVDQGAPKFQTANQACGRYRPPYMPSNAAYNAWARTHGGAS